MTRAVKRKTLTCSDLEWEQIKVNAKQANMSASSFVMACTLERVSSGESTSSSKPTPDPASDLFDEDHPLALNASEQHHLYKLVKYIAAAQEQLLAPIGSTPITFREMVHFIAAAKREEMIKSGRLQPIGAVW